MLKQVQRDIPGTAFSLAATRLTSPLEAGLVDVYGVSLACRARPVRCGNRYHRVLAGNTQQASQGLKLDAQVEMKTLTPIAAITLISLVALAAACGGSTAQPDETKASEYALAPGAVITVRTGNAAITVRPSHTDAFKVKATLHNPSLYQFYILPAGAAPNREVLVSAQLVPDKKGDASAEIVLEIPDGVTLRLDGANGTIDAEGLNVEDANLITTNGAVTLKSSTGNFTANTTNGALTITGSEGTFWTQTTNAPVEFDGIISGGPVNRFKTTNGDVTVRLGGTPDLRVSMKTETGTAAADGSTPVSEANGAVVVRYGQGIGQLDTETTSGNIRISLAP